MKRAPSSLFASTDLPDIAVFRQWCPLTAENTGATCVLRIDVSCVLVGLLAGFLPAYFTVSLSFLLFYLLIFLA